MIPLLCMKYVHYLYRDVFDRIFFGRKGQVLW